MTSELSPNRILVTGGSSFVGSHVVLRLLQLGYAVRTTVRASSEERLRAALHRQVDTGALQIACADLLSDTGWHEAASGCQLVIHAACPYPYRNPRDENKLIAPARDGTLRALRAAQDQGAGRVVLLSTIGAIYDGHEGESGKVFTEADWINPERARLVYHKAKAVAERAAWDFVQGSENSSGMEMVSINPTSVFGPVLDGHRHTSVEWYRTLMLGQVPGVPDMQMDLVDVRDLAEILVQALRVPAAAGRRFICSAASIKVREFASVLHEEFGSRGYRIPTKVLPTWIFKGLARLDPRLEAIRKTIGWKYGFSTAALQSVFGWRPRPYRRTILDMAESLIEHGVIEPPRGWRPLR